MKKVYTEYKLTDPMLQRLSATSKPGGTTRGGTSMQALHARDLVIEIRPAKTRSPRAFITKDGVRALEQARAEGW